MLADVTNDINIWISRSTRGTAIPVRSSLNVMEESGLTMISQTAEYALRAVVFLGKNAGSAYTADQIAKATQVPAPYLSKVLQPLIKARLVQSQRGLGGGFSLDKKPGQITILQVINAVDPIERIEVCPLGLDEHSGNLCPLHKRLDDAVALIEEAFGKTTIQELLETPSKAQLCLFPNTTIAKNDP
jgi:Rrf2 family nitric oxide-sensitive transcriptional repressor